MKGPRRGPRGASMRRRPVAMQPTLLHITNGESAGNTLRQTALGGAVLPWQDTLHEGPIPALPRKELLRKRARFLADCGWGRQQALLSSLERRGGAGSQSQASGRTVLVRPDVGD